MCLNALRCSAFSRSGIPRIPHSVFATPRPHVRDLLPAAFSPLLPFAIVSWKWITIWLQGVHGVKDKVTLKFLARTQANPQVRPMLEHFEHLGSVAFYTPGWFIGTGAHMMNIWVLVCSVEIQHSGAVTTWPVYFSTLKTGARFPPNLPALGCFVSI